MAEGGRLGNFLDDCYLEATSDKAATKERLWAHLVVRMTEQSIEADTEWDVFGVFGLGRAKVFGRFD